MKKIPLDALHRELGAKFGPFAGYDMPIQYPAGLKAEHLHTREQAGLFDVSHMGQLRITAQGGSAEEAKRLLHQQLEAALPCDFNSWPNDTQRYSVLLNDQGGIEDDLMLVWREGSTVAPGSSGGLVDLPTGMPEVRMVVNASNRDADLARLKKLAPQLTFEWVDAALIALQGPAAESVLQQLDPKAATLTFMQAADLLLCGVPCFTTRSGYTGEDGFEISIPAQAADRVVRTLMKDVRVQPVGLGARDTLRLEAGLPLHGHDIAPQVTPIEAGLSFAIAPSRRRPEDANFPGAATVLGQLAHGAPRKLVGLISKEPVPIRAHAQIVNDNGTPVGEVTSGTVSPSLGHPVMLALIETSALGTASQPSTGFYAIVRDKKLKVEFTKLPFVAKRYKR